MGSPRTPAWTLLLALLLSVSPAHAVLVDGDLNDWIKAAPTGKAADWLPLRASTRYLVEDQYSSYLDPGYGGQEYDAEALYFDIIGDRLYLALVTGKAPAGGYEPGDIALDFGNDGTYEIAIVTDTGGVGTGVGGDVYVVSQMSDWLLGGWRAPDQSAPGSQWVGVNQPYALASEYRRSHPAAPAQGTKIGEAELVYTQARYNGGIPAKLGAYGGPHYLIEASLPLALFPPAMLGQDLGIHWTMACANDWIKLDVLGGIPPAGVPEPPLWSLVMPALAGIVVSRGKARRR